MSATHFFCKPVLDIYMLSGCRSVALPWSVMRLGHKKRRRRTGRTESNLLLRSWPVGTYCTCTITSEHELEHDAIDCQYDGHGFLAVCGAPLQLGTHWVDTCQFSSQPRGVPQRLRESTVPEQPWLQDAVSAIQISVRYLATFYFEHLRQIPRRVFYWGTLYLDRWIGKTGIGTPTQASWDCTCKARVWHIPCMLMISGSRVLRMKAETFEIANHTDIAIASENHACMHICISL